MHSKGLAQGLDNNVHSFAHRHVSKIPAGSSLSVFCRRRSTRPHLAPSSPLPLKCRATKSDPQNPSSTLPPALKNPREAVERGLELQKEKNFAEAVSLYKMAMQANPNDDEARAAQYNMGCAYAKLKKWREATDCVVSAINDYNLKLSVALQVWEAERGTLCICFVKQGL